MKEKLLKNFQKLSFSEKKKKILLLLEWLKDSDSIFKKAMKYISVIDVDEEFLCDTYNDIVNFWILVSKKKWDKKQNTIRKNIKKIKEKEQKEKEMDLLNISDFTF